MVGRNSPGAVRLALDAACDLPHRFQPPDVGFGKALAGGRIVLQMRVDRVAPAIGGGDFGDRAIGGPNAAAARPDLDNRILGDRTDRSALPDLGIMGTAVDGFDDDIMTVGMFVGQSAFDGTPPAAARCDLHDRIFGNRIDQFALADLGVMGATINAVDQQIVAVVIFVRQPTHDDASDNWRRALRCGIVDDAVSRRAFELPRGQFALHGANDVAPLADAAQGVGKVRLKPPGSSADPRGQAHTPQLLQAADTKRLVERIIVARADKPHVVHVADQPSIDRGQSFLIGVGAQPFLNLQIGARPEIEVHDVPGALAEPMRNILGPNHQVAAAIVLAAQHDMGVRMAGVEMIHGHPIEPGAEILFHLAHQPSHERLQVLILVAILG